MHDIEGAVGLTLLNDARNVDLAGTLRDHFNVDALLAQGAEEAAGDADHAAQLAADQGDDGHVRDEIDVAPDAEIINGALERFVLNAHFLFAVPGQQGNFRVQGHRDVDLRGRDEVDAQAVLVQDAEDGHEESVSAGALFTVHVKHGDAALDGHGCRTLGRIVLAQVGDRAVAEEASLSADLVVADIWVDDSAGVARVHDVLDPDRDAGTDDLVHGERVDDLGSVEGQLSSLAGRDSVEETSSRNLARVRGENTVDFLPDLELLRTQADGGQSGAKVGVATANVLQKTTGNGTEVSSDDRHGIVAVLVDTLSDRKGQVLVEVIVQALSDQLESDDVAQVNVNRVGATVLQQSSHVQAAELLANGDDHVVGLVRNRPQELRALQNLEQLEALGVDFLSKVLLDGAIGNGILAGLDVVDTDGLDDVAELLRVLLKNITSGAQKAVGRTLALGRSAASGADDSGAVFVQACPASPSQQFCSAPRHFPTPFCFPSKNVPHPTYSTMS